MTATEPRHYFSKLRKLSVVDPANGVIRAVSLISLGAAKGHKDAEGRNVFVDETTLEQIYKFCQAHETIKVKADHGSGVLATIGYIDSFSLEATAVRGDLHLYEAESEAPRLFEIAAKNPTHLGISLEFVGEDEVVGTKCMARCDEVITAALVSDPAANKSLYSSKTKTTNLDTMPEEPKKDDAPKTDGDEKKKTPSYDELAAMFAAHKQEFDEFKKRFADSPELKPDTENTQGTDGEKPKATDPATEPKASGDNDIKVTKAEEKKDDEPDGDEKKLQRAAELGAEKAIKAFAARLGTNVPPSGAPASTKQPEVKTFAQIVEDETKNFAGDKNAAMIHCIKTYKKEYEAQRLVSPR